MSNHGVEGGETEKLQRNGEATNLALGKMDAGEGELMLSPAQSPQVKIRYHQLHSSLVCDVLLHILVINCLCLTPGFARTPRDQIVQSDPAPRPVAATG